MNGISDISEIFTVPFSILFFHEKMRAIEAYELLSVIKLSYGIKVRVL